MLPQTPGIIFKVLFYRIEGSPASSVFQNEYHYALESWIAST